jgi:thioredoxin-like negative regulator of GroEL
MSGADMKVAAGSLTSTGDAAVTAFSTANELFVAEDFDAAAPLFDRACELEPQVAAYRLHRAANSIKRKQYSGQ